MISYSITIKIQSSYLYIVHVLVHVWVFFCKKGDCITFWKKKIYEEAGEEKSITIFLYLEPNLHPSLKKIVKSPDVFPIYFYSKQLTTFPLTKIILRKMSVLFAEKNSLIQCILRIFSPFVPKCSMLFHKKNSDCYHWEIWRRKYNLQNVYV